MKLDGGIMRWPWTRETRSTTYTDLEIQRAIARAEGTADDALIASIEAACGLWERGLASADSDALSRQQLAIIGRSLLLSGESVWPVTAGRLISPADTVDVRGDSPNPDKWRYALEQGAPSATRRLTRTGRQVAHFRIGVGKSRYWEGTSPLANSETTKIALRKLDRSISYEAGGPVGSIVAVPDSETDYTKLGEDLAKLKGGAVLGKSTTSGYGEGRAAGTAHDWQPSRIGPEFSPHTATVRESIERSVMAAAGVPTELTNPVNGTDSREAWRRFLYSTLAPVAKMIESEMARVGIVTTLDLSGLGASDLAGRARAYKALREAGMPEAEARRICGF